MTEDQALSILDQAASRAQLTRQEHVAIQEAVTVLAKAIAPKQEAEPVEDAA